MSVHCSQALGCALLNFSKFYFLITIISILFWACKTVESQGQIKTHKNTVRVEIWMIKEMKKEREKQVIESKRIVNTDKITEKDSVVGLFKQPL